MTAALVSAMLGVSRRYVFSLKAHFPEEAPSSFADVDGWRTFVKSHRIAPTYSPAGKRSARRKNSESALADAAAHDAYIEARARKTHLAAELAELQLGVIKRTVVKREEVKALFAQTASVVRARVMKMGNDLPCMLVGLTEAQIETVVTEKIRYALSGLAIPEEFWTARPTV